MIKKVVALYVRVSTSRQDVASQVPDLKKWVAVHAKGRQVAWYRDQFTGATLKRTGMKKLEGELEGKSGGGAASAWRFLLSSAAGMRMLQATASPLGDADLQ